MPKSVEFSSVKKLATGERGGVGESVIYGTYLTSQRLVRTETHKLIYYPQINRYQLFDLVKDPDEITDVSELADYAKIKKELLDILVKKRTELNDGLLK